MVFKHFRDIFDQKDLINDFSQLFLVYSYVITRHIPGNIARAFGATRLLALTKPFGAIQSIAIGEVFYRLASRTFCL